jgi:hypothetical protein
MEYIKFLSDSNCDMFIKSTENRVNLEKWRSVKYDTLRVKAESKMYRYNNVKSKIAQKHRR